MPTTTRVIFELLGMPLVHYKPDYITAEVAQRFFIPKLILLIILPIDNYNYNINRVDITNQLRSDLKTH
jgi:hypothetical protein